MKEVNIYYSKIGDQPIDRSSDLLKNIPKDLLTKSEKYVNWQDRELNIFGKLLLAEGLKLYGVDLDCLKDLKYTSYGRPFLDVDIDFNISHSGEYAICVIARGVKLGVDIEKIKDVDLNAFKEIFSKTEFDIIISSHETEKAFYNYWTIKESVIKAIGKGLSIPLIEVKIKTDKEVHYNNEVWYTQDLKIDALYSSHIATDCKEVKFNYHKIELFGKKNKILV